MELPEQIYANKDETMLTSSTEGQQSEQDRLLQEQERQLKWHRQRVKQLVREIEEKDAALANVNARLEQILSSRTWRYGSKLACAIRKIFRPGSLLTRSVAASARAVPRLWRKLRIKIADFAKYSKPIVIPACEQPDVSVIIPGYNEFSYTYDCIRSVVETGAGLAYEVILADACSTDRTKKAEKK